MAPVLSVEDLTVRFGDHLAVDGVHLAVADREIVAVLGPSGSGKSTLLRAIAGLEVPERGRIVRDGADLVGVPTHRRGLGLMFQDHALFPHRDVFGNVAFGLRMHGVVRDETEARVRETLALVGLAGYEHRSVHELSGGEQQRVALARALAPAPALLMLDEPLGALDRALREHLVDELGVLFRSLGVAVLVVTHDHDEAFALGDRVAILHDGRLEQVGTPLEVWDRPATAFVAGFLGWNVTSAFGSVSSAVRPDAFRLDAASTGPGVEGPRGATPHMEVSGTVVTRTFRRDHWRIRVALDDGSLLEVEVREGAPPDPGAGVRIGLDPADLVVLSD